VIKSRRMKLVGHGAHMDKRRCACRVWWEKTTLGRPRHRWKGSIKISKRNLLGEGRVDWIGLTWNRNKCWAVMYAGINFVVHRTHGTCLLAEELCFSRRTQLHGVN
jgi:hypothetical protein